MRTSYTSLFVLALALGPTGAALAQGPSGATSEGAWKLSGSIRGRLEAIDGQPRVGFNSSDTLLNLRTRVLGEYNSGGVRFGAELFDSRVYGADAGTPVSTSEVNALELVQAYAAADVDTPWPGRTSLQIGRFTLNLGSRRLVAADDYRNTTNGYTGVRLDIGGVENLSATLIYVLPQTRLPDAPDEVRDNRIAFDRESDDLQLFGGLVTGPAPLDRAKLEASYFGLRERDHGVPTRERSLDTFGLRFYRQPATNAFDFDVEAFAQTGKIRANTAPDAPTLDVAAWFAHAELGRRWGSPWRPRLAFLFDAASGGEPGGDYERFDTLYGMRRAELAPAGLYNAVGRANLISPGVRAEIVPNARTDAFVALRGLWLESATDSFSTSGARDASGASGDFAGTQLDARLRYWLVPDSVRLEINAVYLDKGEFLGEAPNISNASDTFYSALDLTFVF